MEKTILLPIEIEEGDENRYARAVLLAERLNARLILAATLEGTEWTKEKLEKLHLHLLNLYGYYQAHYNGWNGRPVAEVVRLAFSGSWREALNSIMSAEPVDLIISRAGSENLDSKRLRQLVKGLQYPPPNIIHL